MFLEYLLNGLGKLSVNVEEHEPALFAIAVTRLMARNELMTAHRDDLMLYGELVVHCFLVLGPSNLLVRARLLIDPVVRELRHRLR